MTTTSGPRSASIPRPMPTILLVSIVLASPGRPGLAEGPTKVVVRGSGVDLAGPIPVYTPLKEAMPPGNYRLVPGSGPGAGLPANVVQDQGASYLGVVLGPTKADAREIYSLVLEPEIAPGSPEIRLRSEPSGVTITSGPDGGSPFTRYRVDSGPKPILFPVIGPGGRRFTRAYPMEDAAGEDRDHPHQRSFWFTHGKVNDVDFWTELAGHGSIRETSRSIASGRSVGVLRTTDDWVAPDGRKIFEDERTTRFWDLGPVRLIDFDITLKASNGPLVFGDTKEGAFGLRVASSMDVNRKSGGRIRNAEGLADGEAWGKPSPWVDYTGPIDGKPVGIAILNHPRSDRFPTPWHVRDYGLFAANPFGSREFGINPAVEVRIDAGGSITLRYRVLLHDSETGPSAIAEAFRAYAEPPSVEPIAD